MISLNISAQSAAHPGLKTVVIDPGHGGKDPGALGKNKSQHEKHIVLAVSKMLGQMIKEKHQATTPIAAWCKGDMPKHTT